MLLICGLLLPGVTQLVNGLDMFKNFQKKGGYVKHGTIAEKINRSLGKKVALNYDQYKGLPTSCFGDTEFFVSDVKVIE